MALDVIGELLIQHESGEPLRLTGRGETLSFDLPSFAAGRTLASATPTRPKRRAMIAGLHDGLKRADVTLLVKLAGRPVAQLRPGSKPGLLSTLLGLGAVEIKPLGFLFALFKR